MSYIICMKMDYAEHVCFFLLLLYVYSDNINITTVLPLLVR